MNCFAVFCCFAELLLVPAIFSSSAELAARTNSSVKHEQVPQDIQDFLKKVVLENTKTQDPLGPDLSDSIAKRKFVEGANDFLNTRFGIVSKNAAVLVGFLKLYPEAFQGFISCKMGPKTPAIIANVKSYLEKYSTDPNIRDFQAAMELSGLCFMVYNDWDLNKSNAQSYFHQFPKHVSRKLGHDIQKLLDEIHAERDHMAGDAKRIQLLIKEVNEFEEALSKADYRKAIEIAHPWVGQKVSDYSFFCDYVEARRAVVKDCSAFAAITPGRYAYRKPTLENDDSLAFALREILNITSILKGKDLGAAFVKLAETRIAGLISEINKVVDEIPYYTWPESAIIRAHQPYTLDSNTVHSRIKELQSLKQELMNLLKPMMYLDRITLDELNISMLKPKLGDDKVAKLLMVKTAKNRAEEHIKFIDTQIVQAKDYSEHADVVIAVIGIEYVTICDRADNKVPSYLCTFRQNQRVYEAILYFSPSFLRSTTPNSAPYWKSKNPLLKGLSYKVKINTPGLNCFRYVPAGSDSNYFDFQIWSWDGVPVGAHPGPIIMIRRSNGAIETRN